MAALRVFVSSTAYDLGVLRSSLRTFIDSLGFEPILSEYSDVLFDPREHTHTSCIAEVRNCDIVVLIVGARFGGEAVPEVVKNLDERQVEPILSTNGEHKFSVTQAEAITAFDQGIPVFAFVDVGVLHDYRVYSLNQNVKITYPSISQPDTAEYIFEFINFLQHRSYGNAVIPFARLEDVIDHLRKQWTALFQRLLRESRDRREESRRIDRLSDQFEDLKAALLASVGDGEARKIARGVVRYRRLIDFIRAIPSPNDLRHYATEYEGDWLEFLQGYADIAEIKSLPDERSYPPYTLLFTHDGSAYVARISNIGMSRISTEWSDFKAESPQLRTIIYDTLSEQEMRPSTVMPRVLSKAEVEQFIAERVKPREDQQVLNLNVAEADSKERTEPISAESQATTAIEPQPGQERNK
jgi:Domain of unknown function (DUF4062)